MQALLSRNRVSSNALHVRLFRLGVLIIVAVLSACGGSDSDDSSSAVVGQPPDLGSVQLTMTAMERKTAMDAIVQAWNALPKTTLDADNETLVMLLRTNPQFADAGVSSDRSVWARFKDGAPVIFMDDRRVNTGGFIPPPLPLSDPVARRLSSGALPNGDKAFAMDVSGIGHGTPAFAVGGLNAAKYSAKLLSGSISDLLSIKDAAVLMVSAHGAFGKDAQGLDIYAIASSEIFLPSTGSPEREVQLALHEGLMASGQLVISAILYPNGAISPYYWMITAKFVEAHWTFKKDSLVIIDACESASDDPRSGAFRGMLIKKQAGFFLGWDSEVDSAFAARSLRSFFDRVLGMNSFNPETPPQRPFGYADVFAWLKSIGEDGYVYQNYPRVNLLLKTYSSNVGQLLPTIKNLGDYVIDSGFRTVDERNDLLTINGSFGTEKGTVTVGGVEMPVTWSDTKLVVGPLPRSGAGSDGDVIVNVRDHKSNEVPLTSWRKDYSYTADYSSFIAPSLMHSIVFNLHFRADIHRYRSQPGGPVITPGALVLEPTQDSYATWEMTGTGSRSMVTHTFGGGGTLPIEVDDRPLLSVPFSWFTGTIDASTGLVQPWFMIAAQGTWTVTNATGTSVNPFILAPDLIGFRRRDMALSSDGSIVGADLSGPSPDGSFARFRWSTVTPNAAPLPSTKS